MSQLRCRNKDNTDNLTLNFSVVSDKCDQELRVYSHAASSVRLYLDTLTCFAP